MNPLRHRVSFIGPYRRGRASAVSLITSARWRPSKRLPGRLAMTRPSLRSADTGLRSTVAYWPMLACPQGPRVHRHCHGPHRCNCNCDHCLWDHHHRCGRHFHHDHNHHPNRHHQNHSRLHASMRKVAPHDHESAEAVGEEAHCHHLQHRPRATAPG